MARTARRIQIKTAQAGATALCALALALLALASPAQADGRRGQASAQASITIVSPISLEAEQALSVTGVTSGASDREVVIADKRTATRGGAAQPALVSMSQEDGAYDLDMPEHLAVGPLKIATASLAPDASGRTAIGGVLKIPAGAPAAAYFAVLPVTAVFN